MVVERRIIISDRSGQLAVIEEGKVVEVYPLSSEEGGEFFREGSIVVGKVHKLMPSINAAFLDIGTPTKAFLHYQDLGPHAASLLKLYDLLRKGKRVMPTLEDFQPERPFPIRGKIMDVLKKEMLLPVQVEKEPISTKGYRVSMKLSIPGRYHVLMPFYSMVRVSRRIEDDWERRRLQRVVRGLLPERLGAIVRTAAAQRPIEEIEKDIQDTLRRWEQVMERIRDQRHVLYKEDGLLDRYLRDLVNDEVEEIITDSSAYAGFVKAWLRTYAPHKQQVVHFRKEGNLFKSMGIDVQLNALSQRVVRLDHGAYIVMDETEALHVFDVNSGSKNPAQSGREETVLAVNLRAAEIIAQILRLRDIGGLIVIDFIDMERSENRHLLYRKMKEFMKRDHASHTILPLSKFGLMQITRQRNRESQDIGTAEKCPLCLGAGKITPLMDVVENLFYSLGKKRGIRKQVRVHPFLRAYLLKGFPSIRLRWLWDLHKWVVIIPDEDIPINAFVIED